MQYNEETPSGNKANKFARVYGHQQSVKWEPVISWKLLTTKGLSVKLKELGKNTFISDRNLKTRHYEIAECDPMLVSLIQTTALHKIFMKHSHKNRCMMQKKESELNNVICKFTYVIQFHIKLKKLSRSEKTVWKVYIFPVLMLYT